MLFKKDRQQMVDTLLQLEKGLAPKEIHAKAAAPRDSLNFAMPGAISATSGYATDRPALGKLSPPSATAERTRLFHAIVGQAK
jgi:hypothetical protein